MLKEKNINGANFILKFPKVDQGVLKLNSDAELKRVNYELFVPKYIGYFQLLPTRKNEYNSSKVHKKIWEGTKKYINELRKNQIGMTNFIDVKSNKDSKLWRGSLKSKNDFLKICTNFVVDSQSKDELNYALVYIDYDKDTKDVIKKCVSDNQSITVKDFFNSMEYRSLMDYVKRNAQKFAFDVSTRMGFYVNRSIDIKSSQKFKIGKPDLVDFEKEWVLNQIKVHNNELHCFHNVIQVPNVGEIIKYTPKEIHIPKIKIPSKHENQLAVYQVFNSDISFINLLDKDQIESNEIHFIGTKRSLDIKPSKMYTKDVSKVKVLIPQLVV